MPFNKKVFYLMIFLPLLFFILIAFNVTPFLRGPGDWPPEWRWPYFYINTLNRIWFPLTVIFLVIYFARVFDGSKKFTWKTLFLTVFLSVLFQYSVLYFSRSGISVLIHRIINPDLNGYFTAALKINNLGELLSGYQKNVLGFPMHASGHPPGGVIFFWLIEKTLSMFTFLTNIISRLNPAHADVNYIWRQLTGIQKVTAFVTAFLIPILGSLNIIPLFLTVKKMFDLKTAVRSILISVFLPGLMLFTPLNDVFLPMFFLWSFYFFISGLEDKKKLPVFFSGIIFSIGLFFSLSLIPLIFIYFYYLLRNKKYFISFLTGLALFYVLLYFFRYNVFTVSYTLMTGLPKNRSYFVWVFYNLYDFFVFSGIPLSIIYVSMFFRKISSRLFVSFTLMILILCVSGAVRGEVGRIWIPLMYPLIIISAEYLNHGLGFSKNMFLALLIMQAFQILVLQEFWVMLW